MVPVCCAGFHFMAISSLQVCLLRKELFPDLLESVIPECFYPSISLGTVRFSNRRESRRERNWTPDPFDVAQGRGEQHSRTTIKTLGGDTFGINSHRYMF